MICFRGPWNDRVWEKTSNRGTGFETVCVAIAQRGRGMARSWQNRGHYPYVQTCSPQSQRRGPCGRYGIWARRRGSFLPGEGDHRSPSFWLRGRGCLRRRQLFPRRISTEGFLESKGRPLKDRSATSDNVSYVRFEMGFYLGFCGFAGLPRFWAAVQSGKINL